jgi:predicted transcriptional regulator
MTTNTTPPAASPIELTAAIVAAYVGNNAVQPRDIASLMSSVHTSLVGLGAPAAPEPAPALNPPVSVKKSIAEDYLVSMEDGRRYKSLKRHLSGRGLTPEGYRQKWNLPTDYPMVAPSYSKQRSDLAKAAGLGKMRTPVKQPSPGRGQKGAR